MDIINSLGFLIGTASKKMKRIIDGQLEKYGLTTAQYSVMVLLRKEGELSQVEIASKLIGDKATAGEIINKLIKKGYVERLQNKEDKRAYVIRLSDKGTKISEDIVKCGTKVNDIAFAGFSKDEQIEFITNLRKIIKNTEMKR